MRAGGSFCARDFLAGAVSSTACGVGAFLTFYFIDA